MAFQFFGKYRNAFGASFNTHRNANLQHGHDLFGSCTSLERSLDVPASAWCIHVRDGGIKGDADQLHEPRCEKTALVYARSEGEELIGPGGGKFVERIPCGIPLTDRAHRVARRRRRLW